MTPALREACARALHVFTADGEVLQGADAVLFVYEQLGFRAARLGRKRPLLPLLERGYRVVADNRKLFGKVFFRRDRGPGWAGADPADGDGPSDDGGPATG